MLSILMLALVIANVMATPCCPPSPDIKVFVHDDEGTPLSGMDVTVDSDGYWGCNFGTNGIGQSPWKIDTTDATGYTDTWTASANIWYRAKVTNPGDWTCSGFVPSEPPSQYYCPSVDWDSSYAHAYTDGQTHTVIDIECVPPEQEIPEFSTIGAGIALAGIAGFVAVKRKKKN